MMCNEIILNIYLKCKSFKCVKCVQACSTIRSYRILYFTILQRYRVTEWFDKVRQDKYGEGSFKNVQEKAEE